MTDRTLLTDALAAVELTMRQDGYSTDPAWQTVRTAARCLLAFPTDEQVEAAAREHHRLWVEESLNPDDPDDTYYSELWDEMEDEDREWYLAATRRVLEAVTMIGDNQ